MGEFTEVSGDDEDTGRVERTVPVEVDGQRVLLSLSSAAGSTEPVLGEEQEIAWRPPRLETVLDSVTAVARALGTRLRQTGASKATVEFGCDVCLDTGQLLAVLGRASAKSAWKVTLEWTSPAPDPNPAPDLTSAPDAASASTPAPAPYPGPPAVLPAPASAPPTV